MAFTKRTYVGKGKWYIKKYGAAAPLAFVGNVSEATFSHEENKISVPDYTEPGGGEYDSLRRVNSVSLQLTKWDILVPESLVRLLRGTASAQTSLTAIVDEPHVAYVGGVVQLLRIPNNAVSITVKDSAGTVTYTEGTDYVRTLSGVEIISGGTITDASTIKVSYTPVASDNVEALTIAAQSYSLLFEGLNEASDGSAVLINVHRFRPGVPTSMSWISQEFLSAAFAGDVLKDTTIVGTSLSKFYNVNTARPT